MSDFLLRRGGAAAPIATLMRAALLSAMFLILPQVGQAQSFQFSSFSAAGQTRVELPALLGFAGLNAGVTYSAAELNDSAALVSSLRERVVVSRFAFPAFASHSKVVTDNESSFSR